MKAKEVQICPKCGSPDIETDYSNPGAVATGFFQNIKKCNRCSHQGTFFPKIPKNKIKIIPKNKIKNRQYLDKTFARGYFSYTFIITAIFLLSVGAIMIFYKLFTKGLAYAISGFILLAVYYLIRKQDKNI